MKKLAYIVAFFVGNFAGFTQEKPKKETKKDTIKTEVVKVVTSYAPKISDAFKIKQNPKLNLNKDTNRKALDYSIFSAPVASTFIPKSGKIKGIDIGKKERLYANYLALGFGNNTTPFGELLLNKHKRFKSNYGLHLKYTSSKGNINTTPLNSNFSNFYLSLFTKNKERYFDWNLTLNSYRKQQNWYGLPASVNLTNSIRNTINVQQTYNTFELLGNIIFDKNNYLQKAKTKIYFFTDAYGSNEIYGTLNPEFIISLKNISYYLTDLFIDTKIEGVVGNYRRTYNNKKGFTHTFFNGGIMPYYKTDFYNIDIKLGTKMYLAGDFQQGIYQFFIYPDVQLSYPIIKNYANIYLGAGGDLHMNSFQNLSNKNPYVSPDLFITQTNEKYNYFGGFNGKITHGINFNVRGTYKEEEDKPLFIRNNSKSNGTVTIFDEFLLSGYEYGNSFNVVYEDVKTLEIFTEINADISKQLNIGFSATFNSFTQKKQLEMWNTPTISGQIAVNYKQHKWYASMNTFYVGERKDIIYNHSYPSAIQGTQNLDAYFDINLNGGYHFNDKFSAFIKLNNLTNTNYERFANFNVQGFQALGGFTWKFDF